MDVVSELDGRIERSAAWMHERALYCDAPAPAVTTHSHGTAVASMLAGRSVGVLPASVFERGAVRIHDVCVAVPDDVDGLDVGLIELALAWIAAQHPSDEPALLNLSFSLALDQASSEVRGRLQARLAALTAPSDGRLPMRLVCASPSEPADVRLWLCQLPRLFCVASMDQRGFIPLGVPAFPCGLWAAPGVDVLVAAPASSSLGTRSFVDRVLAFCSSKQQPYSSRPGLVVASGSSFAVPWFLAVLALHLLLQPALVALDHDRLVAHLCAAAVHLPSNRPTTDAPRLLILPQLVPTRLSKAPSSKRVPHHPSRRPNSRSS